MNEENKKGLKQVINEIAEFFIERGANNLGPVGLDEHDLMNALWILSATANEVAWAKRSDAPQDVLEDKATVFGNSLREIIKEYTGVDPHGYYTKDSEV